jgi:hypothetical protein
MPRKHQSDLSNTPVFSGMACLSIFPPSNEFTCWRFILVVSLRFAVAASNQNNVSTLLGDVEELIRPSRGERRRSENHVAGREISATAICGATAISNHHDAFKHHICGPDRVLPKHQRYEFNLWRPVKERNAQDRVSAAVKVLGVVEVAEDVCVDCFDDALHMVETLPIVVFPWC